MAEPRGRRLNPGFGYLLVTTAAWGCNWPVMKLLMREWPPFSFRILAGGGAVLPPVRSWPRLGTLFSWRRVLRPAFCVGTLPLAWRVG